MRTFPVKLPDDLWLALTKASLDARKTLHEYILDKLKKSLPK
jgi:hypothetical protein